MGVCHLTMEREIRYCTTEDGVRIAYSVEGEGPPLLFVHYVYAFSLSHLVPSYDDDVKRIASGHQLIRYDMRGTGLSQRDTDDFSPAAQLKDMEAVAEALRLHRFTLLGAAAGGPRTIAYAAAHPDQVAGLILYASFARLLDVFPREQLQAFATLAATNWQFATRTLADISVRSHDEQEGLRWARLTEQSTSGKNMARIIEANIDGDVSDLLPRVECPTLVCHSRNDALWPFDLGRRLAEGIPNARLFAFDGDRGGPFTDSDQAIDAMQAFLKELASADSAGDAETRPLTPREIEILRLIAAGMTSQEISRHLKVSVRTVGRHITNIYNKIDARGRADATAYALRHGLAGK